MDLRKFLLGGVAACVALPVAPANAADLPVRMPAKAPWVAPVASWIGFYVGINGGAAWLRTGFDAVDATDFRVADGAHDVGGTLGGQAGYNWQFQNFVLGLEGDINWVQAQASGVTNGYSGGNNPYSSKLSWLATIRGRVGFLLAPPTLIYATGGYAVGGLKHNSTDLFGFADDVTRSGWTVGGGIEHMLAPHWTVKAEALYVDLGSSTIQGAGGSGYIASFSDTAVIARVGANFKF